MKKSEIKSLIKEEIKNILNENSPKYKTGDALNYMGTKHEVVSDDGFVVKLKLPSGKIKTVNHSQLKSSLSEENSLNYIGDLQPGKYKIDYKYKNMDDVGFGDITMDITERDIEMDGSMSIQNFINPDVWEGKVISIKNIKKVG